MTLSTVREGFRGEDSENSSPLRTEVDSYKAVKPRSPTISAHSNTRAFLIAQLGTNLPAM